MPRILVTHSPSHPVRVDLVSDAARGYRVDDVELPAGGHDVADVDPLIDAMENHDALVIRPGRVTQRVLDAAPSLQVIAIHGSGYDHVDLDAATREGVVVTHNPEAPGPAVVEHTFGFMFSLLRGFPCTFETTAAGDWNGARTTVPELGQQTVGVVGLGTIGFDVARIAAGAFDADVLGYDPYVHGDATSRVFPRYDRQTVEAAGIELVGQTEVFTRADIVSLHLPLTETTRGVVGADELAALEDGYLINTARGGVIDAAALVAAVDRGLLAGVALDVMPEEPPPTDHPLLGAPGVYVTPHIAGVTAGYLERAPRLAVDKIRQVLAGNRPDTVLNPDVYDE